MKNYKSQLRNALTGASIAIAGGAVYVAAANTTRKLALFNPDTGLPLANPVSLVNGSFDFNTADNVAAVDLFIQSPTGHFIVVKNVAPSGDASINIDTSRHITTMVVPFNILDTAAATETRTGFTVPGAAQPNPAVDIKTLDAGITIDFGTLSTDSGDADGFVDGISTANATYVKASLQNGSTTLGVDLFVQDSANAGDKAPEQNTNKRGKEITYTLQAGADTAAGYLILPVALPVSSL